MRTSIALLFPLLLLAAAPTVAGTLAPTRASDVVTLVASYDPPGCPQGGTGAVFDRVLTAEGEYLPITIPQKRVLVLTSIRWLAIGPANEDVSLSLRPGPETAGFTGITLAGARTDANGRASGEAKLEPGLVVRNLANLCVRVSTGSGVTTPGNISAVGFFAKDR